MTTKNNRDSDRESERPYMPKPPQHMDPSKSPTSKAEKDINKHTKKTPRPYSDLEREKKSKPKQLGDSASEIDDETTI